MTTRYRLGVTNLDAWGEPKGFYASRSSLRERAERHGPIYNVGKRGDEVTWGPDKPLKRATRALYRQIKDDKVGAVWFLKCEDGLIFRVHKVDIRPPVTNTEGNDQIDLVYTEVMSLFEGVYDFGICNCRRIDGSSTWSQHAWCNAWDIGSSKGTAGLNDIAHWLVNNAARLNIAHVLWQGHNLLNSYPVADHYDHVHVDCNPQGVGNPPCA